MSNVTSSPQAGAAAPDYAASKQRQQAGWASGDFAVIGMTLQPVGESLAEAADIRAQEDVIDIAAGNGNATRRDAGTGAIDLAGTHEYGRGPLAHGAGRVSGGHHRQTTQLKMHGKITYPERYKICF